MEVLKAELSANASPLITACSHAREAVAGLKEDISKVSEISGLTSALTTLGISFAAFKGVEGIGEAFKGVFEQGKALRAEARATGESITSLITLQKAYSEVGLDSGSVQQNLAMLQNALGGVNTEGEPTKKIFEQLGLSMSQLKNETAVQQFKQIGESISHLATQSDKMAAVRAIFGRQGAGMINILSDPKAIEDAANMTAEKAAVMERSAALFTRITNDFEAIGMKVQGFFIGAGEGAAMALEPVLNIIKQIDTVKIGESAGTFIKIITGAFQQGKFSELLVGSMNVAGMTLTNWLSGSVVGFGEGLIAYIQQLPSMMVNAYTALKEGLIGAVQFMGAMLLDVFGKPIQYFRSGIEWALQEAMAGLSKVPGLNKLLGVEGFQASSFQDILAKNQKTDLNFGNAEGQLALSAEGHFSNAQDAIKNQMENGGKKIMSAFRDGFKNGAVYDPSQIKAGIEGVSHTASGIVASIPKTAAAAATTDKGNSLTGANVKEGAKALSIEGDRLAKMGLFIGGGGAASQSIAQKTADNTAVIAKAVTLLATKLIRIPTGPIPHSGDVAMAH